MAYLLAGGADTTLAVATGLGLLGLAQLILFGYLAQQDQRIGSAITRLSRQIFDIRSESHNGQEALRSRLSLLENEGRRHTDAVAHGLSDLKTSYAALKDALSSQIANREPEPAPHMYEEPQMEMHVEPVFLTEPVIAAPPPAAQLRDVIHLALEPIVDMQTQRTAHYRVHVSMDVEGQEIDSDQLMQYVARMGTRPSLDLRAARECLSLLMRLRARDPDLCIMLGIGAETLADDKTLTQILAECERASSVAPGLVFELSHASLAGLSTRGLEGLARIARRGQHFALVQASVAGLDLQAMNTLNVRYVGIAAAKLETEGFSGSLIGFAQLARLSRVQLVVMDVRNPDLVPRLASVSRLACGPCFAEPRRVKQAAGSSTQAAPSHINIAA